MMVPILLVLAVVFLVLGFVHVVGLVFGIGIAVACILAAVVLGGTAGARVRRW
jgi:hypothetical protein